MSDLYFFENYFLKFKISSESPVQNGDYYYTL